MLAPLQQVQLWEMAFLWIFDHKTKYLTYFMTPWCHQMKTYSSWRLSEFLNPIWWKLMELLRRHSTATNGGTNGNLVVETQEEVKGSAKYLSFILWESWMKALRCNGNPFSIYCGKSHPVWSHKKTSRNSGAHPLTILNTCKHYCGNSLSAC